MLALHITLLNPSYGRSFVAAERPFLSASAPSLKSVQFGAPNRVRYAEILRRVTKSPCQSQNCGIWMRYLDISYLVIRMIWGYDNTIYRDTSWDKKPDQPYTPGENNCNENPPPCCVLLRVSAACLCPLLLGLSPVWLFFVVLLRSISWIHRKTDRTTSKHKPCPLTTRPTTWAHDLFINFPCFPYNFSFLLPGTL